LGFVLGSILLVGGCVETKTSGNTNEYSYKMWAPLTVLLIGLAAAPVGLLMRNSSKRAMWVGLIAAPVLLIGVAPGLFMNYAKVDDNHFEGRDGIWFAPKKYNIQYSDLERIDHTIYETRGRRGRKNTKERLEFVVKSGEVTKLEVGGLIEDAGEDVLRRAMARNVKITSTDKRK
jgi:hypothetical protein